MAGVQKEASPCSDPPVLSLSVQEATAQQGQTALSQGVPVKFLGHLHDKAQRQPLPAAPRKVSVQPGAMILCRKAQSSPLPARQSEWLQLLAGQLEP